MEIREFAEIILFGENLNEKLTEPTGEWTDQNKGAAISVPLEPGRSPFLKPVYRRKGRFDFPKTASLADPRQRGKALHYFANHELEAMELMALALIKFPESPKTYRWALVRILTEEQKHLRLYLNRMQELGVEFGEFPLSGFFWKTLSPIDDLKQFTVAMNLTLEQANLDHCLYFQKIFNQVDDPVSASLMGEVFRDELGHVRHGLSWFNQWRQLESQWNHYLKLLPAGLNPARARGKIFSLQVRKNLGFEAEFIKNLEVYSHSKGRVPDLYYFYPFVEYELAAGPCGINIPHKINYLKTDLETLPMFLAKQDDMVLVDALPRAEFLKELKEVGFHIPQFVVMSEELKSSRRRIKSFKPWGWCYHTQKLQMDLKNFLQMENFELRDISFFKTLYSKKLSLGILKSMPQLCDPLWIGEIVTNEAQANESVTRILATGYKAVIKGVWGSSGQNQIQVAGEMTAAQQKWLKRLLREQSEVIVEPWLPREFDFSIQIKVLPNGAYKFLGYVPFISDEKGKYRGAWLGPLENYLKKEVIIFLHEKINGQKRLKILTDRVAVQVTQRLYELGYRGTAGIDCFIFRDLRGDLKIKPLVEINVRHNMGEITLNLSRHIRAGRWAQWRVVGFHDIQKMGYVSLAEFAEAMKKNFPLKICHHGKPLIDQGVLFTTDVVRAQNYLTLLEVRPKE